MPSRDDVIEPLKSVENPELMMSIVDLGLVYRVEVGQKAIEIDYTLTSPGCPLSEEIERDIVANVEIISDLPVQTKLVWNPPWSPGN